MKPLLLMLCASLILNTCCIAQNQVADQYPGSSISAIDYATGQLAERNDAPAILFKDAFINLVYGTPLFGKMIRYAIGRKTFVITQLDPQTNGNTFTMALQKQMIGQTFTVFTCRYNADQNTLSMLNPQSRQYVNVPVLGNNMNNLNNCMAYGKFNAPVNTQVSSGDSTAPADSIQQPDSIITANNAPPELKNDPQSECPVEGYLWQPGNWSYAVNGGYYWVPGAWVAPPNPGLLWTPPYWAFDGGVYVLHTGYWGSAVGFYGGLFYGNGYWGEDFVGGRWDGVHFVYNTAIMRVGAGFRYRYEDRSVLRATPRIRKAFHGPGDRGPTGREKAAELRRVPAKSRITARNDNRIRANEKNIPPANIKKGAVNPANKKNGGLFNALKKVKKPAAEKKP